MTLPCPTSTSTFADLDAPQVNELPEDYQPTIDDLEALAILNADSFIPRDLPFADWLAQKARQTALIDDPRDRWLAARISELSSQAAFLGASDGATFNDRDEVLVGRNGSGRRGQRRPWLGVSVAAINGIADALGELPGSYPEVAATLRRHLRVLELAAGGRS